MSGRRSRTKGASAERELVKILRPVWPDVCRNLEQVRTGCGRDLDGTGAWVVQIKRRSRVTPSTVAAGLTEAVGELDGETWRWAAVLHRSDRAPWRVTVRLGDLLDSLDLGGRTAPAGSPLAVPDVVVELSFDGWLEVVEAGLEAAS